MAPQETNSTPDSSLDKPQRSVALEGKAGRIRQWVFKRQPRENMALAILRSWLRIMFIMIHESSSAALSLRASALTYSIVLSMVPILAMSTAVLKGLGRDNQLKLAAYKLIDQLEPGPDQVQTVPAQTESQENKGVQDKAAQPHPPPDATLSPPGPEPEKTSSPVGEKGSLTAHLRKAVDTTFAYVEKTNFAALGAFGIVGLLLAIILVLSTIEEAMNAIWHTKKGRSVFRKIMDYLALLILLPISINVALAGDAVLESQKIMSSIYAVIPSPWLIKMLFKLLPFLCVTLSLMVMYLFFPNVRVKTHAAFAGALFAAFFWFVLQKAYIVLQIGVAKYNAIYGSFATVPLFLIWIQIGWTFILLGATMAYAVQNRHQYHLPGLPASPQRELQLAFDVLNTIYTKFARRQATSLDDLARANKGDLPGDIQRILNRLVAGGLVYRTENNGNTYAPAAPSENIEAGDVVKLFLGQETILTPGGRFSAQVIQAAEKAIPREAFPLIEEQQGEAAVQNQKGNNEKTS